MSHPPTHNSNATGSSCSVQADRRLVDRCVAGDPSAWEQLYDRYHDALLMTTKLMLGPYRADPNVVDEIAGRVWYSVVANGASLLDRFDPNRGCRLYTFLATIAKSEASVYFRSERRRRVREQVASRRDNEAHADWSPAELREFTAELTSKEAEFLHDCLLTPLSESNAAENFSDTNRWQLTSRLRRKLLAYFESA